MPGVRSSRKRTCVISAKQRRTRRIKSCSRPRPAFENGNRCFATALPTSDAAPDHGTARLGSGRNRWVTTIPGVCWRGPASPGSSLGPHSESGGPAVPFERPIASSFAELKEDMKSFFQTRVDLLLTELSEKVRAWRTPAILLAIAALLLASSWLALIFSVIAAIHAGIAGSDPTGPEYAWLWGGLVVTFLLGLIGALLAIYARATIKSAGLKPTRTLRVLKQDQEWVQKQT